MNLRSILLGVFPFLTAGNISKDKQVYYEGGVGLGIGLKEVEPTLQFRMDFPFWRNKPLAGEKESDFKRVYIRRVFPLHPTNGKSGARTKINVRLTLLHFNSLYPVLASPIKSFATSFRSESSSFFFGSFR
jgi:hypothetical protein